MTIASIKASLVRGLEGISIIGSPAVFPTSNRDNHLNWYSPRTSKAPAFKMSDWYGPSTYVIASAHDLKCHVALHNGDKADGTKVISR